MQNYSFFIGSDISKNVIDVSYHQDGKANYLGQYSNNTKGFNSMFKKLSKITQLKIDLWFVCFENTGIYSKPFFEWLHSMKIPFREEYLDLLDSGEVKMIRLTLWIFANTPLKKGILFFLPKCLAL